MIEIHSPFKDFESIQKNINNAVDKVINSGKYINSFYVEKFEEAFAEYIQVEHCVAVANGTDAIRIALIAMGVNPGEEVITAANAGGYTTAACYQIGAQPVYVDVDEDTLIDLDKILLSITSKTRVVVATHLYGQMVDVRRLRNILPRNILILEDCAQSHGATLRLDKAGSVGDCATFSFYPTKILGACGDAGAILTNSIDIATRIKRLRTYGWGDRFIYETKYGGNSRMDEIQAAILCEKLHKIEELIIARRCIAELYRSQFPDLDWVGKIDNSVFHLCVLRIKNHRHQFISHMANSGIETSVHYPVPDYLQPAWYNDKIYLENTENYCSQVVSIPLRPSLSGVEVKKIINTIKEYEKYNRSILHKN